MLANLKKQSVAIEKEIRLFKDQRQSKLDAIDEKFGNEDSEEKLLAIRDFYKTEIRLYSTHKDLSEQTIKLLNTQIDTLKKKRLRAELRGAKQDPSVTRRRLAEKISARRNTERNSLLV